MTVDDDIKSYEARQERARERAHEVKMRGHNRRMARIESRRDLMRDSRYRGDLAARTFMILVATAILIVIVGLFWVNTRPTTPPTDAQLQDQRERYEICMQVEKDQYVCDD